MERDLDETKTKVKALRYTGAILIVAGVLLAFVNPLLAILPIYAAYLLLRRSKKHSVARGESVLQNDTRAPVVYLRSFKDEELESSSLYRFKNLAASDKTWLAATVPNNSVQEQDALGYLFRNIGPYIALGRPGEKLPELGSSKLYSSNEEWQETIRRFFNDSKLIVFRAGITDSLKWELVEIVQTIIPRKVLMILPVRDEDYLRFIQWANSVLPKPLPKDLPSSRLVTFDDTWSPAYLPKGRTLTDSLRPFFEENGIVVSETFWEKFLEHNGLRW